MTKIIDGDTFETASRKNPVGLANVYKGRESLNKKMQKKLKQ